MLCGKLLVVTAVLLVVSRVAAIEPVDVTETPQMNETKPKNESETTGNVTQTVAPLPVTPKPEQDVKFNYLFAGKDWGGGCFNARDQSPVDIRSTIPGDGADGLVIDSHYPVVSAWDEGLKVRHTCHFIQLETTNFTKVGRTYRSQPLGFIQEEDGKYDVKYVRFHAPSEHTLAGVQYELEAQVYHHRRGAHKDEGWLVVAALFQKGKKNAFLESLHWNTLPESEGKQTLLTSAFTLRTAFKGLHLGYYAYEGSLTVPPCSSGVQWRVLETIQELSPLQLRAINTLFQNNPLFAQGVGNARAVQPLGGRQIRLHNHHTAGDGLGKAPGTGARPEDQVIAKVAFTDENAFNPEDKSSQSTKDFKREAYNPEDDTSEKYVGEAKDFFARMDNSSGSIPSCFPPQFYSQHGRDWSGLCRSFPFQSPIDILVQEGSPHGDFEATPAYEKVKGVKAGNIGASIKLTGAMGRVRTKTMEFEAKYITFHSPSEHKINGLRAALEMQIVHEEVDSVAPEPELLISSVLFHEGGGPSSVFLEKIGIRTWPLELAKVGDTITLPEVDLSLLHRSVRDGGYYTYLGSESAPPCRRARRLVYRNHEEASAGEIVAFRKLYCANMRAIQDRRLRGVQMHGYNEAGELPEVSRFRSTDGVIQPAHPENAPLW